MEILERKNYERIEQVFIEYHFGPAELPRILEGMGFSVLCSEGTTSYVKGVIGSKRVMGWIIATR